MCVPPWLSFQCTPKLVFRDWKRRKNKIRWENRRKKKIRRRRKIAIFTCWLQIHKAQCWVSMWWTCFEALCWCILHLPKGFQLGQQADHASNHAWHLMNYTRNQIFPNPKQTTKSTNNIYKYTTNEGVLFFLSFTPIININISNKNKQIH